MSQFVSDELETIDCGSKEWVKIPKEISYEQAQVFSNVQDKENVPMKMMLTFVKEWNFDDGGKVAEINEANIKRLNIKTITLIAEALTKKIAVD